MNKTVSTVLFWSYFFSYLALPIGYLLRLLYSHQLPVSELGLFYAVLGFLTFVGVFIDVGLSESWNFFGSKYLAKKSDGLYKRALWRVFLLQVVLAGIIGLALVACAGLLADMYFSHPDAKYLLLSLLGFVLFGSLSNLVLSSLAVMGKAHLAAMMQPVRQLLQLILSLLILFMPIALWQIGLFWSISSLATLVLFALLHSVYFSKLSHDKSSAKLEPLSEYFSYASSIILSSGIILIFSASDTQVLTLFSSLTSVGIYSNAQSLAAIVFTLITPVQMVLYPLVAREWQSRKKTYIREIVSFFLRVGLLVFLPLCALLFLFTPQLLNFLFGSAYVAGSSITRMLLIGMFLYSFGQIFFTVLAGLGNVRARNMILLFSCLLNLVLNLILVQYWDGLGVATATSISMFVLTLWAYVLVNRLVGVHVSWFFISKLLVVTVASTALTYSVSVFLALPVFIEMLVLAALFCTGYCVGALMCKLLTREDYLWVKKQVQERAVTLAPLFRFTDRFFS